MCHILFFILQINCYNICSSFFKFLWRTILMNNSTLQILYNKMLNESNDFPYLVTKFFWVNANYTTDFIDANKTKVTNVLILIWTDKIQHSIWYIYACNIALGGSDVVLMGIVGLIHRADIALKIKFSKRQKCYYIIR